MSRFIPKVFRKRKLTEPELTALISCCELKSFEHEIFKSGKQSLGENWQKLAHKLRMMRTEV